MLETTNAQYAQFLNENGGKTVAGNENGGKSVAGVAPWIKIVPANPDVPEAPVPELDLNPALPNPFIPMAKYKQCAVVNVSWYGSGAYCNWSGKALPTVDEWQSAAKSNGLGIYPWGNAAFNPTDPSATSTLVGMTEVAENQRTSAG